MLWLQTVSKLGITNVKHYVYNTTLVSLFLCFFNTVVFRLTMLHFLLCSKRNGDESPKKYVNTKISLNNLNT
jgi:hypothetical protein